MKERNKRNLISGLVLAALLVASVFAFQPSFNDISSPGDENNAAYAAANKAPDYGPDYNPTGTYPNTYVNDYIDFAALDSILGTPVSSDPGNPHGDFKASLTAQYQNTWILINNAVDLYNLSYRIDGRSTGGDFNRNPAAVSFYSGAKYKLADYIDYSVMASHEGFITLGSLANPFRGVFDGQGFNIEGLFLEASDVRVTLNLSGERYFAMFNNNAGTITNLGIVKPVIDTSSYPGGSNYDAVRGAYAGGLCGYNSGTIKYCFVDNAGSTVSGLRAAGVCVTNAGTIENVYFAGALAATDTASGTLTQPIALSTSSAIKDAWYDSSLCIAAINDDYGIGVNTATLKAKSAVLTADEWYFHNIAPYDVANNGYPRLAGVASVANSYRLKRPADLIYLSRLLNSPVTSFTPTYGLIVQADINMSYVSETAYKSPLPKFYGTIGHATNTYSIINLRIVVPAEPTNVNLILSGMLSCNVSTTGITMQNITFVGGYVKQPVYESGNASKSYNKIFCTGMAVSYSAYAVTLKNVNSSAKIIINERDGNGKYTNIGSGMYVGGLIGCAAAAGTNAHSLDGVSFSGNIYAGTHTTNSVGCPAVSGSVSTNTTLLEPASTTTTFSYVGGIAGFYGGCTSGSNASVNDITVFGGLYGDGTPFGNVYGLQLVRKDWTTSSTETTATVYIGGLFGDLRGFFGTVSNIRNANDVWSSKWSNVNDNILENNSQIALTSGVSEITTNNCYVGGLMGRGPGGIANTPSGVSFTGTVRAIEHTGTVNVSGNTAQTLAKSLNAGGIMAVSAGAVNFGAGITAAGSVNVVNGQTAKVNRTALYIGGIVSPSPNSTTYITVTAATPNMYIPADIDLTFYTNNLIYYAPLGSVNLNDYSMTRNVKLYSPEAATVYLGGITFYGNSTNCSFAGKLTIINEKGGAVYAGGIGIGSNAVNCTFGGEFLVTNGIAGTNTSVSALGISGIKFTGACTGSKMTGVMNVYHYGTTAAMNVHGITFNATAGTSASPCEVSGTVNAYNYSTSGAMYVTGFAGNASNVNIASVGTMSGKVNAYNYSTGIMYVAGFSYGATTTAAYGNVLGSTMSGEVNAYNYTGGAMYVSGFNYNNTTTANATATVSGTMSGTVNAYNNNTAGSGAMIVAGFSSGNSTSGASTAVLSGSVLSGTVNAYNDSASGAMTVAGFSYNGNVTSCTIAPRSAPLSATPVNAVNLRSTGNMTVTGFSYSGDVSSCTSPAAGAFSADNNLTNSSTKSGAAMYIAGFSYSGAVSNCVLQGNIYAKTISTTGLVSATGFSYSGAVSGCNMTTSVTAENAATAANSGAVYAAGISYGTGTASTCTMSGTVTALNNTLSTGNIYAGGLTNTGAVGASCSVAGIINCDNRGSAANVYAGGISCSGSMTTSPYPVFSGTGTLNVRNYGNTSNTGAQTVYVGGLTASGGTLGTSGAAAGPVFRGIVNYNTDTSFSYNTGHTITSLFIGGAGASGSVHNSVLSEGRINLGRAGVTLRASSFYLGGLAGQAAAMTNCANRTTFNFISTSIYSTNAYIGGMAGYQSAAGTFSGCANYAKTIYSGTAYSGIYLGTLFNANSTATVRVGGIIGMMYGSMDNAFTVNSANVEPITVDAVNTVYIGGIIGYGGYGSSTNYWHSGVSNVINKGALTLSGTPSSSSAVGGIMGSYGDFYTGYVCFIKDSTNFGDIICNNTAGTVSAGGIIGITPRQLAVSGCVNSGRVYQAGGYYTNYLGGIVGNNTSTLTFSSLIPLPGGVLTASVTASIALNNNLNYGSVGVTPSGQYSGQYCGGIIGCNSGTSMRLNNNINHGSIGAGTGSAHYSGGIVGYSGTAFTLERAVNYGKVASGTGGVSGGIIGYRGNTVTANYLLYVYRAGGAANVCGSAGNAGTHIYTTNGAYSSGAGDTSMGTVAYAPENGSDTAPFGIYGKKFAFRADERPEWGIAQSARANYDSGSKMRDSGSVWYNSADRTYNVYAVSTPENQSGHSTYRGENPAGRKYGRYLTENILTTGFNYNNLTADNTVDVTKYTAAQITSDINSLMQIKFARDCEILTLSLYPNTNSSKVYTPLIYDNYAIYGGADNTYPDEENLDWKAASWGYVIPDDLAYGDSFGYIYFYSVPTDFTSLTVLWANPVYYLFSNFTVSDKAVYDFSGPLVVTDPAAGTTTAYYFVRVSQNDAAGEYAYKYWLVEVEFNHLVTAVRPITTTSPSFLTVYAQGTGSDQGSVHTRSLTEGTAGTLNQYGVGTLPANAGPDGQGAWKDETYFIIDYQEAPNAVQPVAYSNGFIRAMFNTQGLALTYQMADSAHLKLYNASWVAQTISFVTADNYNLAAFFNTNYSMTMNGASTTNGRITGVTDADKAKRGWCFFQFGFGPSLPAGIYYLVLDLWQDNEGNDIRHIIQFAKAPRPQNNAANFTSLSVRGGESAAYGNYVYSANFSLNTDGGAAMINYNYGDYFVFDNLNRNWTNTNYGGLSFSRDTMTGNTAGNSFFYALNLATGTGTASSQYATIFFPYRIDFSTSEFTKYYTSFTNGTAVSKPVVFELTTIVIYFYTKSEDGFTVKHWIVTLQEGAPDINPVSAASVTKDSRQLIAEEFPLVVERKETAEFTFTLGNYNNYMLGHLGGAFLQKDGVTVTEGASRSGQAYTVKFIPDTKTGLYYVRPYMEAVRLANQSFSFSFINASSLLVSGALTINDSTRENAGGVIGAGESYTHIYNWKDITLAEFSIEKLASKDSYASGASFDLKPNRVTLSPGAWDENSEEPYNGGAGVKSNFLPSTGHSYDPLDPSRVKEISVIATYTNDEESFSNRVSLTLPEFGELWYYPGGFTDEASRVRVKWYNYATGQFVDETFALPENITVMFRVYAEDKNYWTDYTVRLGEGLANKRLTITMRVPLDFEGYLIVTLYTVIVGLDQGQTTYKMTRFTTVVFVNNNPAKYTLWYDEAEGVYYKNSLYRLANHIPALYSIEVRTVTGYDIYYEASELALESGAWKADIYGRPYLDLISDSEQWSDLIVTLKHNGETDPWGLHYEDWYEQP